MPFLIVQEGERKHKAACSAAKLLSRLIYYHIHHTFTFNRKHRKQQTCLMKVINLTFIDLVNSIFSCLYLVQGNADVERKDVKMKKMDGRRMRL